MKKNICFIFTLFLSLLFWISRADDSNSDPTKWIWRTGSASTISDQANKGYRIVNIELYSKSPFRLTALFVKNTGSYQQGWWWFYNIDALTLSSHLSTLKARIVDLEVYELGGQLKFTVLLAPNTGSAAKTWYYYYGISLDTMKERLEENKARLIDIERYKYRGKTNYAVVMIKNSGSDLRTWWWGVGKSVSQISSSLSSRRARLTDIEYIGGGRYMYLMERSAARWYWYYGLTSSSIISNAKQNGARPFHAVPYTVNGAVRWATILISNINPLSIEVFNGLQPSRSGGSFGFYMRQIGGSVHASLMSTAVYEPASSIKALHHAHAMKQVQIGEDFLTNTIPVPNAGICPLTEPSYQWVTLRKALERMMRNSKNADTMAITTRYGESNINLSADELGMLSSGLNHRIGCGSSNPPEHFGLEERPNELTLKDVTTLYSRVATGWLLTSYRTTFWDIMRDSPAITYLVTSEANSLPGGSSIINEFWNHLIAKDKGGSYTWNSIRYRSIGGYVRLPYKSCTTGAAIIYKHFVFGAFVNKATSVTSNAISNASRKMFQDEVKKALQTFVSC